MVIVGRPNVGKSSILNTLVERERAIVTEVPGTTRDTLEEALDIGGLLFLITDTAGIRETTDPVEKESIRRTERALAEANLVLLIFDGSESLKIEDKMIIDRVKGLGKQVVAVINKLDLEQRIEKKKLREWLSEEGLIEVSALERRGVPKLIHTLETTVLSTGIPREGEVVLTRLRHRIAIAKAEERIKQTETSLKKRMSQEFIALDLRGALDALGEVTGQTTTEDILENIFSEFCVGK